MSIEDRFTRLEALMDSWAAAADALEEEYDEQGDLSVVDLMERARIYRVCARQLRLELGPFADNLARTIEMEQKLADIDARADAAERRAREHIQQGGRKPTMEFARADTESIKPPSP